MKFINYLTSISGIGIFPMIALIIFFSFFVGLLIYLFTVKKNAFDEVKNIPLNDQPSNLQL